MKNILKNVYAFIEQHRLVSCIIGGVIVLVMVATPLTIHLIKNANKKDPPSPDLYAEKLPENEEDEPTDRVEEPIQEEVADPKVEETTPEPTENNSALSEDSGTTTGSGGSVEKNEQGGLTFHGPDYDPSTPIAVQTANTSTGISWDGKSPIVYTYADGTTGTTPQDGANYEIIPGVYGTYTAPKAEVENVYSETCKSCGKKQGDGAGGTCLQFWAFDDNCPHCGTLVPVNTCHTCG